MIPPRARWEVASHTENGFRRHRVRPVLPDLRRRQFVQQVSPGDTRRWSTEPDDESARRWFAYDSRNLHLMSGALLQISMVLAIASTIMALQPPIGEAVATAAIFWFPSPSSGSSRLR